MEDQVERLPAELLERLLDGVEGLGLDHRLREEVGLGVFQEQDVPAGAVAELPEPDQAGQPADHRFEELIQVEEDED